MLSTLRSTGVACIAFLSLCTATPVINGKHQCSITAAASSEPYKSTNVSNPKIVIDTISDNLAPGYLFFVQSGVNYITTSAGELVWASTYSQDGSAFRKQNLNGEDVLTYWTGEGGAATNNSASHGYGRVIVLNSQYEQIHAICLKLPGFITPPGTEILCQTDVHESQMTDHGTMLVTAYNITEADLSQVGGPKDGWVYDSMIVEVDVASGDVVWMWSALKQIPVTDTNLPWTGDSFSGNGTQASPFDYLHVNSAQQWGENILINGRHTSTTYLINRAGEILWRFSGIDGGDFGALPNGVKFTWEHFARLHQISDTKILYTNFANDNYMSGTGNASHGIAFELNLPPNKASPPKLVANMIDPTNQVISFAGGSNDYLGDGRYLLDYGIGGHITEFHVDESGNSEVALSITLGAKNATVESYRAFKESWHATPAYEPSLVVMPTSDGDKLAKYNPCPMRGYVSWNGATDVTAWEVFVGESPQSMECAATIEKKGFETEFVVPPDAAYVQVRAVGSLGSSNIIAVSH